MSILTTLFLRSNVRNQFVFSNKAPLEEKTKGGTQRYGGY